ncbi:MAG: hypothetical protein QXP28_06935, partial [Archaeoglobaceae archaeon]
CPTCPPAGSLSKVRGATLSGISCSPVCSSYNNSFVGWIDGQSIWANSTQNCAWQNFTFTLPYTINSSVSPILIWNGNCKDKAGPVYALIYLNNNLENARGRGLGGGELEVQLNANDFVNQQILVSIVCSNNLDKINCPSGQSPWNLSTNYIEILFLANI